MKNKANKTDEQLDYIARTTLSERVNDYLFAIEINQATFGSTNPFTSRVPTDGFDVVWTDIHAKGTG